MISDFVYENGCHFEPKHDRINLEMWNDIQYVNTQCYYSMEHTMKQTVNIMYNMTALFQMKWLLCFVLLHGWSKSRFTEAEKTVKTKIGFQWINRKTESTRQSKQKCNCNANKNCLILNKWNHYKDTIIHIHANQC